MDEEKIATCVSFLTNLDFIPADAGVTGAQAVAGLTFVTNLSDYNPETNTLTAVAMRPIPLPAAQVEQLDIGDTLIDGQLQEEIVSIDKSEEGVILINDDIELRKKDEEYHVYMYEIEYIEQFAELTVEIPDNLNIFPLLLNGERMYQDLNLIAKNYQAVFAFSDDFFSYRYFNKMKPGIIIRNGRVWSEKTLRGDAKQWPPLDVMALFNDGSMKAFVSDAHTASE